MSDHSELSYGLRARVALEKSQFRYTHSLGQNFLLDDAVVNQMLDAAEVTAGDHVLEIGPGAGVMTALLAARGARVLAVEIDRTLEPVMQSVIGDAQGVSLRFEDALRADLSAMMREEFGGAPYRVVANLPYYITTDLLLKLFGLAQKPVDITALVQAEAAERIMARPGQKPYCALAAKARYFGEPEVVMSLPPAVFTPSPHVDSALLRIRPYKSPPVIPADEALFYRLIDAAFLMRRKTLGNNLRAAFSVPREQTEAWLQSAGLSPTVRGEALSLEELAKLSDVISGDRG